MKRTAQIALTASAAAILPLAVSQQTGSFGQSAAYAATQPEGTSAVRIPTPEATGSGEQLRVLTAVYAAWSQNSPRKGANDSPDIAAYNFRIAVVGVNYKVTLSPKNPLTQRISMPEGMVRTESGSSTFIYFVRRADFKVVASVAIS